AGDRHMRSKELPGKLHVKSGRRDDARNRSADVVDLILPRTGDLVAVERKIGGGVQLEIGAVLAAQRLAHAFNVLPRNIGDDTFEIRCGTGVRYHRRHSDPTTGET